MGTEQVREVSHEGGLMVLRPPGVAEIFESRLAAREGDRQLAVASRHLSLSALGGAAVINRGDVIDSR
jgi:hypothetical protein